MKDQLGVLGVHLTGLFGVRRQKNPHLTNRPETGSKWLPRILPVFVKIYNSKAGGSSFTAATQRAYARHGHFHGVISQHTIPASMHDLEFLLDLVAPEVAKGAAQ